MRECGRQARVDSQSSPKCKLSLTKLLPASQWADFAYRRRPLRRRREAHPLISLNSMKNQKIVVCGGGGFIGGHLVSELLRQGHTNVRSVDIKPMSQWYQV